METNYLKFIDLNKKLLDCYGSVPPNSYIVLDPSDQKDVCYSQRSKLEEMLTKGKIAPADIFAAHASA